LIARQGFAEVQAPTIRLEEYENWRATTHSFFGSVAFYQPARKKFHIAVDNTVELSVARALQILSI
jgi:hypothetical protein